jgi:hypothetical protein
MAQVEGGGPGSHHGQSVRFMEDKVALGQAFFTSSLAFPYHCQPTMTPYTHI